MKFTGCKTAKPLALCKQGANQGAHVFATKSAKPIDKTPAPNPAPTPEPKDTTDMDIKIFKRLAAMNEVTKAYFIGLEDEAATAFLAKADADQDKEAADAKKAVDDAAAAKTLAETGKSAREVELEKTISEQGKSLEALTKKDQERDLTASLEKRAREDFAGFPGGTEAAVEMLRSVVALDKTAQDRVENLMRSQIAMARKTGGHLGLIGDETKTRPATEKVKALATEKAKTDGTTFNVAFAALAADQNYAEDFAAARAEESGEEAA